MEMNEPSALTERTQQIGRGRSLFSDALKRYEKLLLGIGTIAIVLVVWEIAVANIPASYAPLFSSPSRIAIAAIELVRTGELAMHLRVSGLEFLVGYGMSILVGVPLGIALGWYKRLNYALDPLTTALYVAPGVAFMPLIMIWFGIGLASKVVLIVLLALFPILINCRDAVKTTPKNLIEAARSFQASQGKIFRTIVFPAAVPFILTGLRLGAGRALIGVFVAEMYIAQAGVGFMITQAGTSLNTDIVFVGVIIFCISGLLVFELIGQFERRFEKWRPQVGSGEH
jgi:NitT/TauT family transport system permease protein